MHLVCSFDLFGFITQLEIKTYLHLFSLQLWIDHSPGEMEALKIIGALIMQRKVKEMQRKSKDVFI